MKTTSLKSIYLEECELKEAIVQYLRSSGHDNLSSHMAANCVDMSWSQDGKQFIVSIDNPIEDASGCNGIKHISNEEKITNANMQVEEALGLAVKAASKVARLVFEKLGESR